MPSLRQMKRTSSSESSYAESKRSRRESPRTNVKTLQSKAIDQPLLSPEQILQSSWKFLEFAQFCLTFEKHLELPTLTIDSLESMLLNNEDAQKLESGGLESLESATGTSDALSSTSSSDHSGKFEDLILSLFRNLSHRKKLPRDFDISDNLLRLHRWYNLQHGEIKGGGKPTASNFYQLTMDEKIDILYTLMESIMDNPKSEIGEVCKSGDVEFKRYESIGTDAEGRSYWMFGSERLYREAPLSSVKRKVPTLPYRPHTYELVCQSLDDWRSFLKEICSKRKSGKVFRPELVADLKAIGEDVIEKHEQRERAILRREEKELRAIMRAKAFENMPRKRSSRLEQKKQEREEMMKLEEEMETLEDIEAVRQYEAREHKQQESLEQAIPEDAEKYKALEQKHESKIDGAVPGDLESEAPNDPLGQTQQSCVDTETPGNIESLDQHGGYEHNQLKAVSPAKEYCHSLEIASAQMKVSHLDLAR